MLREMLTTEELEMITHMRFIATDNERNSDFSKDVSMMPTYDWLRFWAVEKNTLSAPFVSNDSLILKRKVRFNSSREEIENGLKDLFYGFKGDHLIQDIAAAFEKYNDITEVPYKNRDFMSPSFCFFTEVVEYPWGDKENKAYYTFKQFLYYKIMTTDNIVANEYNGPEIDIHLPHEKVLHLQNGMKITRLLGKLAKCAIQEPNFEHTYERFEEIRIKHSQIMNEAKLTGTLCLSIHPLDYMTASYNNNDWRSCMHWEDGEFRRGVIEMMNSHYVICAYLESEHETLSISYQRQWNSKKWREFFIVTPELITGIKGYPYWNRELELSALDWLKDIYSKAFRVRYDNQLTVYRTEDRTEPFVTSFGNTSIKDIAFHTGSAMYNDFYNGNDYNMYLNTNLGTIDYILNCYYSGPSECAWCGESCYDFDCEQSMVCSHCTSPYFCSKCGERIRYSEDLFEIDGEVYCRDCYDELPICDLCSEPYLNDQRDDSDNGFVVGYNEDFVINTCNSITNQYPEVYHICDECANSVFRERHRLWHRSPYGYASHYWQSLPIIRPEELTDTGKAELEITHDKLIDLYHRAAEAIRLRIKTEEYSAASDNLLRANIAGQEYTVALSDDDIAYMARIV